MTIYFGVVEGRERVLGEISLVCFKLGEVFD